MVNTKFDYKILVLIVELIVCMRYGCHFYITLCYFYISDCTCKCTCIIVTAVFQYLKMNEEVRAQVSKYELKRRQLEEEARRKQREDLSLSSGDSDVDNYITARQRKKEKVNIKLMLCK